MKKQLLALLLISICSLTCLSQQKKNPKWLSEKGYWMVESNIKTPRSSTVYFFTNDNVLIYQEKIEGVKIKIRKQKTRIRLKAALDQALIAWENGAKANDFIIATAFKK